jgi:cytochrome c-type biogenesis protein CcmH/NrfF
MPDLVGVDLNALSDWLNTAVAWLMGLIAVGMMVMIWLEKSGANKRRRLRKTKLNEEENNER